MWRWTECDFTDPHCGKCMCVCVRVHVWGVRLRILNFLPHYEIMSAEIKQQEHNYCRNTCYIRSNTFHLTELSKAHLILFQNTWSAKPGLSFMSAISGVWRCAVRSLTEGQIIVCVSNRLISGPSALIFCQSHTIRGECCEKPVYSLR